MIKLNPNVESSVPYEAEIYSDKKLVEMRMVVKTPDIQIGFKSKDNQFNIKPFGELVKGLSEAELVIECDFGDKKITVAKDKVKFDNALTEGIKFISEQDIVQATPTNSDIPKTFDIMKVLNAISSKQIDNSFTQAMGGTVEQDEFSKSLAKAQKNYVDASKVQK